jgi:hypothetical protein
MGLEFLSDEAAFYLSLKNRYVCQVSSSCSPYCSVHLREVDERERGV